MDKSKGVDTKTVTHHLDAPAGKWTSCNWPAIASTSVPADRIYERYWAQIGKGDIEMFASRTRSKS
jgi:hypothetical protein